MFIREREKQEQQLVNGQSEALTLEQVQIHAHTHTKQAPLTPSRLKTHKVNINTRVNTANHTHTILPPPPTHKPSIHSQKLISKHIHRSTPTHAHSDIPTVYTHTNHTHTQTNTKTHAQHPHALFREPLFLSLPNR